MNSRKRAVLLNFFIDDGLDADLLTQATQIVTESKVIITDENVKKEKTLYTVPYHIIDDQFKDHFCLERRSFEILLGLLNGVLGRKGFIDSVPLDQKLLYTLFLLRGNKSYRKAGKIFGICLSSGTEIFKWMTSAFATLLPNYVNWSCSDGEQEGELPGVVGVIGECQICLRSSRYFKETGRTENNLVLQAVCDERNRFLDIFIDFPSEDQQSLLLKSPLYERLINEAKPLLPKTKHLVGDMQYPLLLNLMTPYPDDTELTPCHFDYNQAVNAHALWSTRAFRSLKSKFGRLDKLDISSLDGGRRIISACCMLHNFSLDCGESIQESSLEFELKSKNHLPFEECIQMDWSSTRDAEKKRNYLVAKFMK